MERQDAMERGPATTPDAANNMADFFVYRLVREGHGGRTAIEYPVGSATGRMTYLLLSYEVSRVAVGLQWRSIQPGDRVMLALPDSPTFAAAFFGALQIGAVVIMVDPHRPDNEIQDLAKEVEAKIVVSDRDHSRCVSFSQLTHGVLGTRVIYPVSPDDNAVWLYSGGTTKGRQKIVQQRHGSYIEVARYLKSHLYYGPSTRTLSVPRLSFGYATGGNLLFSLAVGGTAILCPEQPTPERVFEQIRRFRPDRLFNTPAFIAKMIEWAGEHRDKCDLSSLTVMFSAGQNLPPELRRRWMELFPDTPIWDCIGFAEHWHFAWCEGVPIAPVQLKICDEAGDELPDGEIGWLWVTGPALAKGYYNNPEATAEAFRDGWFVPGDLARRQDGIFTYEGRAASSFKVKGQWVLTPRVEQCFLEFPSILECAVIPFDDPEADGLTTPAAFLVLRPDNTFDMQAIKRHVDQGLPSHMRPRHYVVVGALPRTPFDKVNIAALKAMLSR